MTAEQLEELLGKDTDPSCENCGRDDTLLISLARRVLAAEKLAEALDVTRHIVAEAARTGFNHKSGDWADRLYANNADITAAITAYREASK